MKNIVVLLATFWGLSAHADNQVMQINYSSIIEAKTDLNQCVGSRVVTLNYRGDFDPVFLVGWYSGRVGAVVESCTTSFDRCAFQTHGNIQIIEVNKLPGQRVEINHCDLE